MSAMLYGLDTTVVADVQGTVIQRFGEPEKLAWIGVGFPLGSIAIILSLYDESFPVLTNYFVDIVQG
jgi:hypothetical protein